MVPFIKVVVNAQEVKITCPAPPNVRHMRAIGDFNSWTAPGQRMTLSSDGLQWNLNLKLEPGIYRYVLLPNANTVPLGADFQKNVQTIVLTPVDYRKAPGIKGDGLITKSGVLHYSDRRNVFRLNGFTYELLLRTRKNDVDNESVAISTDDGEQKNYPMHLASTDQLFDYYSVKVVVSQNRGFTYRFLLDDGHGTRSYDRDGLSDGILGGTQFEVKPGEFKIPDETEKKSRLNRSLRTLLHKFDPTNRKTGVGIQHFDRDVLHSYR